MGANRISRRDLLGGMMAAAGASAFGGLALAKGLTLAAHEELVVGFISDPWVKNRGRQWHQIVRDDGSEWRMFCQPCDHHREGGRLAHGARVWAACPIKGADNHRGPVRILRLEPAVSGIAFDARMDADYRACANGEWVRARMLTRYREGRSSILIRCYWLDAGDPRWLYRLRPIEALKAMTPKDRLLVKFGHSWDGWRAFEVQKANDDWSLEI